MVKKMKYLTLIVVILFSMNHLIAQSSIVAIGGGFGDETGSVSFTVGQNMSGSIKGDEGSVNAFIQQAYDISVITDVTEEDMDVSVSSYPNPTTDILMIETTGFELDQINFSVFDISGKEIYNGNISNGKSQISLANHDPGTYIIRVSDEEQVIKSFQVIKN